MPNAAARLSALLILLAAPLAAAAAATAGDPVASSAEQRREVSVTAYNNNLALVREVRDVGPLPGGEFHLHFLDVPSRINPRTVALRSLAPGGGLLVLEQNYEYDLLSPSRLMEKHVGRDLQLVETAEDLSERTTSATLLSTNEGYVFRSEGRILLGHPGRIVLPGLPEGLFSRPTLVWKLSNAGPARQPVETAYLTEGVSWSADYVAVADAETKRADLTGWVTLENLSGASWSNARLKLVAGDVQRVSQMMTDAVQKRFVAMEAAAAFAEQPFFEYHLYTLDRPTDIRENQTKQLRLFSAASVPVRKRLILAGDTGHYRGRFGTLSTARPVDVFLEFRNTKEANLGIPLPAGVVRVYQTDRDGAQQFAGEDRIAHTPRDETVTLRLGAAFDVVADRVQTDWRKINVLPYDAEAAFEIRIRNHKDEAVTVTVREALPQAEWKVLEQSPEGRKKDARTLEFELTVPARGESVIRYRVALKM